MKYKACIIGGAGLVGSQLLRLLCDDNDCEEIICFSRNKVIEHSKIVSFLDNNISSLFKKEYALNNAYFFSCLGTTIKRAGSKSMFYTIDHDLNLEFAYFASCHNADFFGIISSRGANPKSPFFYLNVKGKLEIQLKSIKSISRICILRPGLLLGNRIEIRFFERLFIKLSQKFSFIKYIVSANDAKDVAEKLLSAAKNNNDKYSVLESQAI